MDLDNLKSAAICLYLYSIYAGEIARLNSLLFLKKSVDENLIANLNAALNEIAGWASESLKGVKLVEKSWGEPKTVAAKKAFDYLRDCENLNLEAYKRTEHLISRFWTEDSEDFFIELISFSAKRLYTSENFVNFGTKLNLERGHDMPVAGFEQINEIITNWRSFFPLDQTRLNILFEEINFCKVSFKIYCLDASSHLSYFKTFSFDDIKFPIDSAFFSSGLPPYLCGIWASYDFDLTGAKEWSEAGFASPAQAWHWRFWGFNSFEARDWFKIVRDPRLAFVFKQEGLDPTLPEHQEAIRQRLLNKNASQH